MAENKSVKVTMLAGLLTILLFVGVIGLLFLFVAGLTYMVCWGFGLEWSWMLALGVFAACLLLRWILSAAKPDKK